jgi:hypothetical protein
MRTKALILAKGSKLHWDLIEKTLTNSFGVNTVTYHVDGVRGTAAPIDWVNDICRLIKNHPESKDRVCGYILNLMRAEARIKRVYVTEECAAGMYKIVVPVLLEEEIIGFISTCGRPFISTDRIYKQYIQRITGENEQAIIRSLETVRPIYPKEIKAILLSIVNMATAMAPGTA